MLSISGKYARWSFLTRSSTDIRESPLDLLAKCSRGDALATATIKALLKSPVPFGLKLMNKNVLGRKFGIRQSTDPPVNLRIRRSHIGTTLLHQILLSFFTLSSGDRLCQLCVDACALGDHFYQRRRTSTARHTFVRSADALWPSTASHMSPIPIACAAFTSLRSSCSDPHLVALDPF